MLMQLILLHIVRTEICTYSYRSTYSQNKKKVTEGRDTKDINANPREVDDPMISKDKKAKSSKTSETEQPQETVTNADKSKPTNPCMSKNENEDKPITRKKFEKTKLFWKVLMKGWRKTTKKQYQIYFKEDAIL